MKIIYVISLKVAIAENYLLKLILMIIHDENTNEITTVKEVGIAGLNLHI